MVSGNANRRTPLLGALLLVGGEGCEALSYHLGTQETIKHVMFDVFFKFPKKITNVHPGSSKIIPNDS